MPIIVPSSGLIDLALIEPYVLPALSGTPLETVMFQAANAAREFCRRTLIWFEPLATLQTVVDQNAYTLALPDDAEVHKLLAVTIGEQPISVQSYANQTAMRRLGRRLDQTAAIDTANALYLDPAPTVADVDIAVEACLIPKHGATTLPGVLAEHLEALGFGTLARVLMLKSGDDHDPQLAAINTQLFSQACNRVAIEVSRGRSGATIRSRRDPRDKYL